MNKHEYMRLADDGCPNCPEVFAYTKGAASGGRTADDSQPVHGPRGYLFFLSTHAITRWAEGFGSEAADLHHAVRYSRIIGVSQCKGYMALWYEPDAAFIFAGYKSRLTDGNKAFTVMTVVPSHALKKPRDMELVARYRTKANLARRAA